METKGMHTPGPWNLHPRVNLFYPPIVYHDGCIVATVNTSAPDLGEREANARLIAVAPSMYNLLRIIKDNLQDDNISREWTLVEINNIIAKAEGR